VDGFLNYHQATPVIGTSGQPTRAQFAAIRDDGYTTVINLAVDDSTDAVPEEDSIVASLGMVYVHIPVPFDKPSVMHVSKFFRVMQAFEGDRVFVHCAVNARVSAFMYKYLCIVKGFSAEAATSPLLEQWLPQMDVNWKAIMGLSADEIAAG
jgi:protein tyrosine phosphatase (PTP) superfamily phosphohydrolase (DUF442 family)